MNSGTHDNIARALHSAQSILVVSHVRPDGDAIGSVLGIGLSLREAGKKVQMVLSDGVSASVGYLPTAQDIQHEWQDPVDLVVSVDASDAARLGGALQGRVVDVNIDHHITNTRFGRYNFIVGDAAATSEILAEYLPRWSLPVTQPVAEALLSGLLSDTIGFRIASVSPKTLRLAADLMERGANLSWLYDKAVVHMSFEGAGYWGMALSRLKREGRLVWTALTLEDRQKVHYTGNDDADLANAISSIQDVDVTLLFVEQPKNKVKVSWRAQPGFDVSSVALQFGGGGHAAAAGADLEGPLEEVEEKVISATQALLAEKLGETQRENVR